MLIGVGQRYTQWDTIYAKLAIVAEPFAVAANLPRNSFNNLRHYFINHQTLLQEHNRLASENVLLKAKLQTLAALEADNQRLRSLLNSSTLVNDSVLVAELIGLSPNPLRHEIVLNKGSNDHVYEGQPVIDAQGLIGQVIRVSPNHSRVLLISDSNHAVPVKVNRNGMRSVVEGNGLYDQLTLPHVAATADMQVGDLLVTSGLGGRFPVGYPVGVVINIDINPGQAFATITAQPSAQLTQGDYLLLVFQHQADNPNAPKSHSDD